MILSIYSNPVMLTYEIQSKVSSSGIYKRYSNPFFQRDQTEENKLTSIYLFLCLFISCWSPNQTVNSQKAGTTSILPTTVLPAPSRVPVNRHINKYFLNIYIYEGWLSLLNILLCIWLIYILCSIDLFGYSTASSTLFILNQQTSFRAVLDSQQN